jgi:hypothetical protein
MRESTVESHSQGNESISDFLTILNPLLNSLCERTPPDTQLTMRAAFSRKREAGSNQIVVEQIAFGET